MFNQALVNDIMPYIINLERIYVEKNEIFMRNAEDNNLVFSFP